MKLNSLQIGKAMSAALFVLLLSVAGMKNTLAQTQVATLQHGDDISVFYGRDAFVEAHAAATDGDIITLSSGTFNLPGSVNKAITLRGAGVVSDSNAGTTPTVFATSMYINVDNQYVPFQMEGILLTNQMVYGTMYNPKFTKCSFNKIVNASTTMLNAQFVNCMIKVFNFGSAINTTFINSVVWDPIDFGNSHSVIMYNSIIGKIRANQTENVSAYNSVIITDNNYIYGSTSTFVNCIGIKPNMDHSPFGDGYTIGCVVYTSYNAVFETFTGNYSLEEQFILKDNIATVFFGSDGTQVGIHGGLMPYSNRPGYMVLKRCNVANKSTIDGKLNVEIEVVTDEE